MKASLLATACGISILALTFPVRADEPTAAERGKKALTGRHFTPASWPAAAYDDLWKFWEPPVKDKPKDYDRAVRDHYGLHAAPYENGRYPMGIRETSSLLGKGLATDCLLCHGGSILGKSYVGLGNSTLDIQAFFEDLKKASGQSPKLPFTFTNVRGTTESGGFAVFLFSYREPDLSLRFKPHKMRLRDDLCEDAPAWWLLQRKKTMYHTGVADARSVRSIMQFMLSPANTRATFEKAEPAFRDIQAYLLSLEAPRYPFPIDAKLADTGKTLFADHCAKCHGSYGKDRSYPNKVVAHEVIGTDPNRLVGLPRELGELYNDSWFAQEKGAEGYKSTEPKGYQAPPLDGVWATAPYFHNGSAPTLFDVLNSKARPKIFTRSYRTDEADYDKEKVGWKVEVLERGPGADVPVFERRKVYDTTQPGRSNSGHTFGDRLSAEERRAVIEYLKTL